MGIAKCLAREGRNLVLGYNSDRAAADAAKRYLQETYPGIKVPFWSKHKPVKHESLRFRSRGYQGHARVEAAGGDVMPA